MAQVMKRRDTRPSFLVQLVENPGKVDETLVPYLDDASSIKLIMRAENAAENAAPILQGNASYWVDPGSPNAYTGTVEYQWEVGDLDIAPGSYNIEIEVTWAAGEIETFPNDSYFKLIIISDLQGTN